MTINFTFGKCKSRAGYSARLPTSRKLDLSRIKKALVVILETPILLVIQEQGLEIVVHGYGEILFKNGTPEQVGLMEKVAERIYNIGLEK